MRHSIVHKLIAILCVVLLALSLASCKNRGKENGNKNEGSSVSDKNNPVIGGGGIETPIIDLVPVS